MPWIRTVPYEDATGRLADASGIDAVPDMPPP